MVDQKVSFARLNNNKTEHYFEIKYTRGLNKINNYIGMYYFNDGFHQMTDELQNKEFGLFERNVNATTIYHSKDLRSIGSKI